MAIDATGIDSWQRSRHYEKRLFENIPIHKKHMPYAKLDILIDVDTGLIHDFVLRTKPRHDTLGAKSIFKRMKQRMVKILADKGYDSEQLHQIAHKLSNVLFAPTRKSSRKKPKGFYRKKCIEKDPEYNRRCRVESVFNALKHRRIHALRSKKPHMKKREIAWHILIYNLEIIQRIRKFILWLIKEPFRTSL
jgi:transposase-like protein